MPQVAITNLLCFPNFPRASEIDECKKFIHEKKRLEPKLHGEKVY